jgi:hypothetical protein
MMEQLLQDQRKLQLGDLEFMKVLLDIEIGKAKVLLSNKLSEQKVIESSLKQFAETLKDYLGETKFSDLFGVAHDQFNDR